MVKQERGRDTSPRLRSLVTDIGDFQEYAGESSVPICTTKSADRITSALLGEKKREAVVATKSLNGIGAKRKDLFDGLTTIELEDRLKFYTKQCNFVTLYARHLTKSKEFDKAAVARDGKSTFLHPEMNAIRLYLYKFR